MIPTGSFALEEAGENGTWWKGPAHQLLKSCAHITSTQEGLTWHGSEHTMVRIYNGKERGEKIMDVGSFFHLPSPGPVYSSLLFILISLSPVVQKDGTGIPLMHFCDPEG